MNFINLLPSTVITKGINKSCLIDIEKSIYCTIPQTLAILFENSNALEYDVIYRSLEEEDRKTFDEYIVFLEKNNFIIRSEKVIDFVYFDEDNIELPYDIQNIIVDVYSERTLFEKLDFISIIPEQLQLRLFFQPDYNLLNMLADYLYDNSFINVEIVFNHSITITDELYVSLFQKYPILSRLVIMAHDKNEVLLKHKIIGLTASLQHHNQCGNISQKMFMPNIKSIALAKTCNSCLSRKLSIDKDGNIKNCPSMPEIFGNIKNTTLQQAIAHPDFKKYWNITKEQIEVCKDCEFRHICTDCRAYVEHPDEPYSKPLKCGYSPYTNVWEEWSTNPLKHKAIEYYGMQELIKKDA